MKKELFDTILNWLNEKIINSDKLKFAKTCIENEEPILYASIVFKTNGNSYKNEKRISLKNIDENELKNSLDEIVNEVVI